MLSAAPAPPSLLFRPHSAHDKRVKVKKKKINQLLNQLFCSNFPYRPPTRELLLYEPTFSLGGPASRVKSSCQVSTCICQDTAYRAKSERAACKKRGQTGRTQMSKLPNPLIQSLAPRSPRITWCHFILAQYQSQQRAPRSLEAQNAVRSEMGSRYNTQSCFLNPHGDEEKC